jgi:cytochrome P450
MREAAELFSAHREDLAPSPMPWDRFIPQGMTRWMRGEVHDEYRRLLKTTFGARLLGAHESTIKQEIERALERMTRDSAVVGSIHPLGYLEDLCFGAWAYLFFGIARDSEHFEELRRGYQVIAVHDPSPLAEVQETLADIEELVTTVMAATETSKPTVLTGMVSRQEGAAENPTTMLNLIYLMGTSFNDVAGLLTWILKLASENANWLGALQSQDPNDHSPQSLADRMVSETLRLEQSEHLYRRATAELPLGDYVIPAGWLVRVCVHESHRDPTIFKDPDRFNPDRFLGRARGGFEPFGLDDHTCTGETLTRLVARSLLGAVAHGYQLDKVQDGPRELSVQRHWSPSSRFRLRVSHLTTERDGV